MRRTLWPYHRAEVRGLDRVPRSGGLVYVGNHNGYPYMALRFGLPIVPIASVGGYSTAIIIDDLPWLAELLGVKERFKIGAWPLMLSP